MSYFSDVIELDEKRKELLELKKDFEVYEALSKEEREAETFEPDFGDYDRVLLKELENFKKYYTELIPVCEFRDYALDYAQEVYDDIPINWLDLDEVESDLSDSWREENIDGTDYYVR